MKKLIVSASIILFVGLAAFAQDGTKKCCDKKGDKMECSTKKCDPKDCTTNLQSGKCDPKDCPTGKEKSCKKSCSADESKKNETKK